MDNEKLTSYGDIIKCEQKCKIFKNGKVITGKHSIPLLNMSHKKIRIHSHWYVVSKVS